MLNLEYVFNSVSSSAKQPRLACVLAPTQQTSTQIYPTLFFATSFGVPVDVVDMDEDHPNMEDKIQIRVKHVYIQ